VLLSYRLPREPSTPRIALWRSLRRLGALQIGDGLAALPLDDRTREQLEWLAESVDESGGDALVFLAEPSSRREQRALETKLSQAIDADYTRLREAAAAAEAHGPRSRRRSLQRLRRQFEEIRARDYLGSPGRRGAESALNHLARLEEEVTR